MCVRSESGACESSDRADAASGVMRFADTRRRSPAQTAPAMPSRHATRVWIDVPWLGALSALRVSSTRAAGRNL